MTKKLPIAESKDKNDNNGAFSAARVDDRTVIFQATFIGRVRGTLCKIFSARKYISLSCVVVGGSLLCIISQRLAQMFS